MYMSMAQLQVQVPVRALRPFPQDRQTAPGADNSCSCSLKLWLNLHGGEIPHSPISQEVQHPVQQTRFAPAYEIPQLLKGKP